jgi:peptidoglycan/xylan/chitin deacetylase (PgdA/CDA1 family)
MAAAVPVLMYHELVVEGRALCEPEAGYSRYCVAEVDFRSHLAWLRANDYGGWNLSEALAARESPTRGVGITFDDGCETDVLNAAPLLLDQGFSATFFVVTNWVGRRGYVGASQLRELSAIGFEIGAHSRSHPFLPDLDPVSMTTEIARCKDDLEQWLGHRIDHFSCPGGRWSPAVSMTARAAGYRTVSTSRPGALTATADLFRLPRTAILQGAGIDDFARVCRMDGQWRREAQNLLLSGAKRLVGNSLYNRLRAAVLNQ